MHDDSLATRMRRWAGRSFGDDAASGTASSASFAAADARHAFALQLRREMRRADRSGSPLSLVLLRSRGAEVAPARLRRLLAQLRGAMRETDLLGPLANDLVAVLLPDTDARGAHRFLDRMRMDAVDRACFAIEVKTYPDRSFDEIANTPHTETAARPGVVSQPRAAGGTAAKRVFDVVLSLMLIAMAGPLMLVTALAIRCTSRGPAIFSQVRLGKDGRRFKFYKFRSMYLNCDDRIHRDYVTSLIRGEHERINQQDAAHPLYKIKSDPRVTPVGAFIRRHSIDELPQLFNVLKGDMSLVGPRPPLAYEAAQYRPWHLRRIRGVRPGITGLWQVEGRSKVSFDEMVRMDLRYIRDRSLLRDVELLVRTVRVVLSCDGAK
jgi:lipopolysaccharide/colanic/teichoic acid biosynthesis glycosyltransferase